MKRFAALLLVLCLLLCGCGNAPAEAPTETAPTETAPTETAPTETAPPPTETQPPAEPIPALVMDELPEIGSYERHPVYEWWAQTYNAKVPVRDDYGMLIPYAGRVIRYQESWSDKVIYQPLYGLCTLDGTPVTGPLFHNIERKGDVYILQDADYHYALCACDGSWYRSEGCESEMLSPQGDRMIRQDYHGDSGSRRWICDLDGRRVSDYYDWVKILDDTGFYCAYLGDKQYLLLDRDGNDVLGRKLDEVHAYGDQLLVREGDTFRVLDRDLEELHSFQYECGFSYFNGPTLIYTEYDGIGCNLTLDGKVVLDQWYQWYGSFYYSHQDNSKQVFDSEMQYVCTISDEGSLRDLGSRYVVTLKDLAPTKPNETHIFDYVAHIYDTVTHTRSEWPDEITVVVRQGDTDLLIAEKDGTVYDAFLGKPLFQGQLLSALDSPAGDYLVILDGDRLLTVTPDGTVLKEFTDVTIELTYD